MSENPRVAVEATLAMLADELAGSGLVLKPGLTLVRKSGDERHVIRTQTSKWNRSSVQARFEMSAWFESAELAAWKKKQWPGRSAAITKFDGLVNALKLKFPGTQHHAEWDVVDPVVRPSIAREAAAIVRDQALPWFEQMGDPVSALDELVTNSIHPSLIYYAVAMGHSDAARHRITEIAEADSIFAELLESVRRNGKPAAYRNAYEPIAWAAVSTGLI